MPVCRFYTYDTGRYGHWYRFRFGLLGYFRKTLRKVPKFPEGKELRINMSDKREIKYTLVPNTKVKSDLWKHCSLHERKIDGRTDASVAVCKQCSFVLKHAGDTSRISNMSTHVKRRHPYLLLGPPMGKQREGRYADQHQPVGIQVRFFFFF